MNDKNLEELKKVVSEELKGQFYCNGDWAYIDGEGDIHYFEDGVELTKGVKVTYFHMYYNGDFEYTDTEGYFHFFRKGVELTKGLKAKYYHIYVSGDWKYKDEEGYWHLYRDGVELTEGVKAISCNSYYGGNWEYQDEKRKTRQFKKDERIQPKKYTVELTRDQLEKLGIEV